METAACSQTALVKLDSCVMVCRVSDLCILVEVDGCTGLLDSLLQRRDPGWFELQNLSDRRWANVPVSIPCGVTPTDVIQRGGGQTDDNQCPSADKQGQ